MLNGKLPTKYQEFIHLQDTQGGYQKKVEEKLGEKQ